MAGVKLNNVTKKYGQVTAVDNINLTVRDKEFLVLVGPSGCGKSTTLRMIAGLEGITAGEIAIGDRQVNRIPPKDRDIAMVFQNYALYPHMNVFRNMAFGLRLRKFSKSEVQKRVHDAAKILDIGDLFDRKPKELSGGQRQRVAMGRAIVRKPKVFLFDEPLSNLDAKLRVQMREELARLHQRLSTTIIYVTHDQVEAMTLANRIVIMSEGAIMQVGAPMEVYNHPQNIFVAGFIGSPTMNLLDCRIVARNGRLFVEIPEKLLEIPPSLHDRFAKSIGRECIFGVRPENIYDSRLRESFQNAERLTASIEVVEPIGSEVILLTRIGSKRLTAKVNPQTKAQPSESIEFLIDMKQMHLFDKPTGTAY